MAEDNVVQLRKNQLPAALDEHGAELVPADDT
jgi:hypothetical protein